MLPYRPSKRYIESKMVWLVSGAVKLQYIRLIMVLTLYVLCDSFPMVKEMTINERSELFNITEYRYHGNVEFELAPFIFALAWSKRSPYTCALIWNSFAICTHARLESVEVSKY